MVEENESTTLDAFDCNHGIVDIETPKNTHLSGRYKKSFAYFTFRRRLPNTLSALINSLNVALKGNKDIDECDLNYVSNSIELLKQQLENNGTLESLTGNEPDIDIWNDFLNSLPQSERSYFKTCWLYSECYLYRRIFSIFKASNKLKNFDYFAAQKFNALLASEQLMARLVKNVKTTTKDEKTFINMLKLNLWGNRCDLSITSGQEVKLEAVVFEQIDKLNANILIDDSARIWQILNSNNEQRKVIDIVCDNAGFELFTDLLLAYYLIANNMAATVRFHIKVMPWFVSDTTSEDIVLTLRYLQGHDSEYLSEFGKQCSIYFEQGIFQIKDKDFFWTTHYEYYRMLDICPSLYDQLKESALIIFKGDLNYRKLLGDFNWDFTEAFKICLRGFQPAPLCSLRTVKGDLICGLPSGLAEKLYAQNKEWMFTGEYGIIQFAE